MYYTEIHVMTITKILYNIHETITIDTLFDTDQREEQLYIFSAFFFLFRTTSRS